MISILPKDIFYLRIFRDYFEIRNVKTNKEIKHIVSRSFSNSRMLVADFYEFEQELRSAIEKVQGKGFFKPLAKMIFQPIEDSVSEYSSVEKRSFRDSCEFTGATEVYLYFGKDKLSNRAIIEGMKDRFER